MRKETQEQIRTILTETGAGAILITDPYNLRYLSGFRGGEGMLVITEKSHILSTDSRYTEAAANESDFTVIQESSAHPRTEIVNECLKAEGIRRVCYEDMDLRCHDFAELREKLPDVEEWIPLGARINALRFVKTEEEIAYLARAEAIGDEAFTDILGILHVGMTEKQVAAELEYRMKLHGAENLSFSSIVASGANSSMPHAIPTDKAIEPGDFVTMDFGCIYEGYCSDMTRTIVMGKANEKQKEIYDLVLRAQENCLAHLKAGMTGKEADAYTRDLIKEAGYGDCFGHGTGHGVGLYIHEDPRISPTDETVLQAGMVETVEPGIYIPGFGGVRIEDMVVITEDGCRNLAKSEKSLIELT